ncbi:hypothetical protein DPMN_116916 [Dreissena polymorpha]|uniref:Uncharacterized protein n=1 Tax=Dreissena polymorpha TaxID=45954 RepID=A0A9D4KPJ5_DREPO|nr:hypothetical protein DPMN_116916 [Dreissena polymorpha]
MFRRKRGAVVASNHHLLVARLKLMLKRSWEGEPSQRQWYNTATLKDTWKQEEFKVTLSNKF